MSLTISSKSSLPIHQSIDNQNDAEKINTVKNLVSRVLESSSPAASINVTSSSSSESDSCVYCIPKDRMIIWDEAAFNSQDLPTLVFWTVFEQLNVQSCNQFNYIINQLSSNDLSLEQAVEKFEAVEHENALRAKAMMIAAAAQKKIAPPSEGFADIPKDFATHYRFQQLKGHSQKIAARLAPYCSAGNPSTYHGTWKIDFKKLSSNQKQQMEDLFKLKIQLEDPASYDRALLKLGCNLKLAERKAPQGTESFLKQASEEIFSLKEFNDALSIASQFLKSKKPNYSCA